MLFYTRVPLSVPSAHIRNVVARALAEDKAGQDITSAACIPGTTRVQGSIIAKAAGVIAGTEVAREVFRQMDRSSIVQVLCRDGHTVRPGKVIMKLSGNARKMLAGERTALNFLQHLSGVATETATFVAQLKGTKTRLLDTRKTIPGMRMLEKYAVSQGGGWNHRTDLADMVLIKDNHLALSAATLAENVRALKRKHPRSMIEVEASTLDEVKHASALPIDVIMLDNMSIAQTKSAVRYVREHAPKMLIEASGMITLDTIRSVARTGVDVISVGRITHSARALDMSLEFHA